ncbi:PspA/IM30 family protein [Alcanivorax sp. 1008]|uniref:PspA/IM30 family protein n=1 Tax=Alcanivorax sp. 1008 TaxID=2816853 RepID=UPI001E14E95F|nr:PspA/IM30 family protein [Alcanivorax sp. 1008]MCC1498351.1 PspA/IM30 family protein [Alcanivorax sp. 1008]
MKESLGSRVGRLVSGGFNALVDAVENAAPEVVMEQATREIDGAVDEVRAELGRVLANRHLAQKRLVEENRKHSELVEKIDFAVREGRDDLAEVAIARQMDVEAQIPVLETAIASAGDKERELEGFISALQGRKREMMDELRAFRESRAAEQTSEAARTSGAGAGGKADRASEVFDRIMERNTGLAGAGAIDRKDAAKLAELEELSRSNRIKERLAAVKAKSGQ